jgi:hypothetical protein
MIKKWKLECVAHLSQNHEWEQAVTNHSGVRVTRRLAFRCRRQTDHIFGRS